MTICTMFCRSVVISSVLLSALNADPSYSETHVTIDAEIVNLFSSSVSEYMDNKRFDDSESDVHQENDSISDNDPQYPRDIEEVAVFVESIAVAPAVAAVAKHVVRIVFTAETVNVLINAWDHVVGNWEFYREAISIRSGKEWFNSCSVDSINHDQSGSVVTLECDISP